MPSGSIDAPLAVRFGKRIMALRKRRKWTYTYMSVHSGIDKAFLHAVEHGTKEPCLGTIEILARSFEMNLAKLFNGL